MTRKYYFLLFSPTNVYNYFLFYFNRLGNGVYLMEPSGASACSFGSDDTLPSTEAFIALKIVDKDNLELKVTEYNIDDYTAERTKSGYICEKEGINYLFRFYFYMN